MKLALRTIWSTKNALIKMAEESNSAEKTILSK